LHIIEIYEDLFSDKKAKSYSFNLKDFGKLIFLFLPKKIRQILKHLKNNDEGHTPQIFFILDSMIIPFDFIYDKKFFMLTYSCGYKIGEPSISGIFYELSLLEQPPSLQSNQYNILIIESTNFSGPLKWDDQQKKNILLFPFSEGNEEIDYITNFFNNRTEVNEITILSGINSTRENILKKISQGNSHIIHLVGNIFYSKLNPKNSFIITNDNSLITFNEIKKALDQSQSSIEPIIVFNVQFFDTKGLILKNVLKIFGDIVNQFNYDVIAGIICKIYPIFNIDSRELISNFYDNLFKKKNQGEALLGARQSCKSGLALSSFILFGKPWKRL
jgi:CHAT domain-containing protein